jgi:serine O-acetyltransferase
MNSSFLEKLYQSHWQSRDIPSPEQVCQVLNGLLKLLFPELADRRFSSYRDFENHFHTLRLELNKILELIKEELPLTPEVIESQFVGKLPVVYEKLMKDANAISKGDPAATNTREVIRTYPGFYAIAIHRLAHEFHGLDVPLIPRILSEYAHSETGIDIHPAATIGENFCIDHGTGLVIGGTCNIGNNVKVYQNVTLGALSVRKELAETKRHPTIENNVVIYSGATILGGETVIGEGSIIGGNVWLTRSVPVNSRIYYQANVKGLNE